MQDQRVKPVYLLKVIKMQYIGVLYIGVKEQVVAAILVHVPEIAIALRKISRVYVKPVIIPLQVTMFSGIDIKCMRGIAAGYWVAAAQYIIQECLAAIEIISLIARGSKDRTLELLYDMPVFFLLINKKLLFAQMRY